MRFELTVVDREGAVLHRIVEAATESAATSACAPGERAIGCRRRASPASVATGAGRRRELLAFCEALEQVLAGGLTLSIALRALAADGATRGAAIAAAVARELDAGRAPSAAFEATGHGWSPFLIALIRSGERSGQLPRALAQFVRFERALLDMRGRVLSASMYPVVLLVVSMLVLLFLLGFVVPKFALALSDLRTELPPASRLIIVAGTTLADNLALVLAPLLAAGALALSAVALPRVRRAIGDIAMRLPGVRTVAELADRAQALRVIAALLGGGALVPVALGVAREVSRPALAARLADAAARVERGTPPSQALAAVGVAGPVARTLLAAAERTGGLAGCFERLALGEETRLVRILERMTTAWGPMLLLAVAAVVGAVVVALYWPMLQVFDSIR